MRKLLLAAALVLAVLVPGQAVAVDTETTAARGVNAKPILGKWKGPLKECGGESTGLIYNFKFVMKSGKPVGTVSIAGVDGSDKMTFKKKVRKTFYFTAPAGDQRVTIKVKRVVAKLSVRWTYAGTAACVLAKRV